MKFMGRFFDKEMKTFYLETPENHFLLPLDARNKPLGKNNDLIRMGVN